jgi:hypothetical protein
VLVVRGDDGDVQIDAVAVGTDQLDAGLLVGLEGRDFDPRRRTRERRKSNEDLVSSGRLWYWFSC